MNPDQAKAAATLVSQQLQNEWMTTYRVLTAVPEGKRDYKPDPNARGAFELAAHLASADVWFLDGIANGKFGTPTEPTFSSVDELGNWYKEHFPRTLDKVL